MTWPVRPRKIEQPIDLFEWVCPSCMAERMTEDRHRPYCHRCGDRMAEKPEDDD